MNSSIRDLFFSFDGRINRAKWWLTMLVTIPVSLVVMFALYALFGVSFVATVPTFGHTLAHLITVLVIAYPVSAITLKRLNDRDRPQWLLAVFWAPTVLGIVAELTGLSVNVMQGAGGELVAVPTMVGMLLGAASFAVAIWMLVDLGILKGTPGPNRHGPDPLARVAPASA